MAGHIGKQQGEGVVGFGKIGIDGERGAQFGLCFGVVALAVRKRVRVEVEMRGGGVGTEAEEFAVLGEGLIVTAEAGEEIAKVGMRLGIIGPQLESNSVMVEGFGRAGRVARQCHGEIGLGDSGVRFDIQDSFPDSASLASSCSDRE